MSTIVEPVQAQSRPLSDESAPDQMSEYFLDLEGLLGRIDAATTYYQVLGLERTAGQEDVRSSFQHTLNQLFPPYAIGRTVPAEITSRIERGFGKASQAFATLATFSRRREYDGALQSIANKPVSESTPGSENKHRIGVVLPDATPARVGHEIRLNSGPQQRAVFRESIEALPNDNRRRCERFKLAIPARVTGHDRKNGKWNEMAETLDVSRTGLRLRLRRRVRYGTVLYLTLPLPTKLRAHGFAEPSYNVYTLVRRIEPPKQGVRAVGLEFLGEHPPAGFLEKPWAVFRSRRWGGGERRRPNRIEHSERVRIEYFDESMQSIAREEARTENVSRFGLRIVGTIAPGEFDLMMVSCPKLKFEGLAALRSRFLGKDGKERLCVQLIDKEFPLRDRLHG